MKYIMYQQYQISSSYLENEHHRIAIVISVSQGKMFFLNKNIQEVEKENNIF